MRGMKIVLVVVMLSLGIGCKSNDEAGEGFAALDEAHKAKEAQKAAELKAKTAEELKQLAEEQEKARKAQENVQEPEEDDGCDPAEGNKMTTDELVTDPEERALINLLHNAEAFRKAAKAVKSKKKKLMPLIRKALRHENTNVRGQAARVIIIRKDRSKATETAWNEALLAEADDDVLGLWAYDLRLYKSKAMMAPLRTRFSCVKDAGAKATIAETLMDMKMVEALPEIHEALDKATDPMGITYLIGALKRMPHASSKPHLEAHLDHEKELVRVKAQELLDLLPKK